MYCPSWPKGRPCLRCSKCFTHTCWQIWYLPLAHWKKTAVKSATSNRLSGGSPDCFHCSVQQLSPAHSLLWKSTRQPATYTVFSPTVQWRKFHHTQKVKNDKLIVVVVNILGFESHKICRKPHYWSESANEHCAIHSHTGWSGGCPSVKMTAKGG